jgi:hypothetical protein
MAMQAQETFVADLADGTSVRVVKGEILHDRHELVKRDQAGTGMLFRPLDMGEAEPLVKPARSPKAAQ